MSEKGELKEDDPSSLPADVIANVIAADETKGGGENQGEKVSSAKDGKHEESSKVTEDVRPENFKDGDEKKVANELDTEKELPVSAPPTRGSSKSGKKVSIAHTPADATPIPEAELNLLDDWRNMRRIIAEDPEWTLATVPLLIELCIEHIITNFNNNFSIINDLLPKHKQRVLDKLPTDIPLVITANLISDESYWKRCCKDRWRVCDVSKFAKSWKRMYFERNLQEMIESFVPESTDPTPLNQILPLSSNYVRKLDIQQLLPPVKDLEEMDDDMSESASDIAEPEVDHFNFSELFPHLPMLEEFHVTFGVKSCGMNFEWTHFNFTNRDCLFLAKSVSCCENLKVFRLHRSKVDDDKCRVLINHLLDHPTLEELDLSHNLIGDRGARAVGKFINGHSKLVKLNLCDNQIRSAGAQALAHALTKNQTVVDLNIRLNRLGDEGGQAMCKALMKNNTLRTLNLASNDMTEPFANSMSQVVVHNNTLVNLDISCNRLGTDGGKQLQEGMVENEAILKLDLRLTECGQESEYCIDQVLKRNKEKERDARLDSLGKKKYGRF